MARTGGAAASGISRLRMMGGGGRPLPLAHHAPSWLAGPSSLLRRSRIYRLGQREKAEAASFYRWEN